MSVVYATHQLYVQEPSNRSIAEECANLVHESPYKNRPSHEDPPQMENYGRPYSDYGIMILAAENPSAEKTPSLLAVWGSLVGGSRCCG